MTQTNLLPCPFCGWKPAADDLDDVLYPSGTVWRVTDGRRHYVHYTERKDGDQFCWVITCNDSMGGCDASIHGDSKQETIDKWNRRYKGE